MQKPRRRFLKVLTASAAGLAVVPACGDRDPTSGDLPDPSTTGTNVSSSTSASSGQTSSSAGGGPTPPATPPDTLPSDLDIVGHIDDFGGASLIEAETYQFYLGLDAGGVYCLDGLCTHNGCAFKIYGEISSTGLDCGCHGSKFDFTGNAINGPATKALATFYVVVDASGNIGIDRFTEVAPDYRAPVPA